MSNWIRISVVVLLVVPFVGCIMSRTHAPSSSDAVPVETLASVAGVWKGTASSVSRLWTDGDVRVSIAPAGSYVAWSDRSPTVAADAGRLLVIDGKLIPETQKLISVFTLVQSHGSPILVVETTGKDGNPYYVPLVRDAP